MATDAPLAILAGTLCLMSHYARTGCPRAGARIIVNLDTLARHTGVGVEFRQLCANLTESWDCMINDRPGGDAPERPRTWLTRNSDLHQRPAQGRAC